VKPLYALVVAHKQLEALDIEEVDEETIKNTLESLEGDIVTKATSIAATVRNMECFAEAIEEAAKKMKARAAKLNKKADRVRDYLMQQMLILGKRNIDTPEFGMKIKKNPWSVIIEDESLIPEKYWYDIPATRGIDKAKIKADIEMGDEVPGARLHQGERLEIKE
jgi:hypothetical protein